MSDAEGMRAPLPPRAPAGRPLAERLGIFQGRLVQPADGRLQSSPGSRWAEELDLAGSLGFAHVELLSERTPDAGNPIWSTDGRAAIVATCAGAGLRAVSLCTEEPLDVPLTRSGAAASLAARLSPLVADLGLDVVVLPLDGASSLAVLDPDSVAPAVSTLAAALGDAGARIAVESSLPAKELVQLLDAVGSPFVGLCYDLGNTTAAGHDPASELRMLGPRVWHVHAKDKDAAGANVRFGTGLVDFAAAFEALDAIGYEGAVTIEATRGEDPVATAAYHREFLLGVAADVTG